MPLDLDNEKEIIVKQPSLFRSFWLAGYEGAYHRLCTGERINMLAVTQHDRFLLQDYRSLVEQAVYTVRESLNWTLIDRGGSFDFSSLEAVLDASSSAGIQVIWSLCHYGWPEDVDIFTPSFVDRFARYCRAVARIICAVNGEIHFYNPINEISFLAWATAEAGFIFPCLHGRAHEVKEQLVRATIAGIEAIWDEDPGARIIHIDPMIQVIAPPGRPDLARHAFNQQNAQFQSWDWIGGWDNPGLGGHPRYLDILGVNYYHDNQWELERERIPWETRISNQDKRWLPFHIQLESVYQRYLRPIFVGETSHFGIGRGTWIRMIAEEVKKAAAIGVPVEGICIYPVLDRPDWHDHNRWHNSGLWEMSLNERGELERVLVQDYCEDLRWAQNYLVPTTAGPSATSPGRINTVKGVGEDHLESNGTGTSEPFAQSNGDHPQVEFEDSLPPEPD
jgi:hypothetical protein